MVDPKDTSGVKIKESDEKWSPTRFQKKKNCGKYTTMRTNSNIPELLKSVEFAVTTNCD